VRQHQSESEKEHAC